MRKADNLPPSCAVVTKSGSLNFLERSGPIQTCNGTALTFILYTILLLCFLLFLIFLFLLLLLLLLLILLLFLYLLLFLPPLLSLKTRPSGLFHITSLSNPESTLSDTPEGFL